MMNRNVLKPMRTKLENAGLLPLERQAALSTEILKLRLETVLPWAMQKSGIDFWLVLGKEYCEDPIMKSLVTWDVPRTRHIGGLAYHYDRSTGKVTAMELGSQAEEMDKVYKNVSNPGEDVWDCITRLLDELKPEKIGIEQSKYYGFCDGISATLKEDLLAHLAPCWAQRLCSAEDLSVRWLQKVTDKELEIMEVLSDVTQDITRMTFSHESIEVGKTTTTDLEWLMRDTINQLGFDFWFGPDIDMQRKGGTATRMFGEVIQPGDLLHCDIGILPKFISLNTDMQWLCYIRKDGETTAPAGIHALLQKGNRFQDIVASHFAEGKSGNDLFCAALEQGKAEGLKPMIYTHPLGTFGHGAGPCVGRYGNQSGFVPGNGERPVENATCYALELNICDSVPEWDGQEVFAYLEEDIYFNGKVRFVHGRQTQLIEL